MNLYSAQAWIYEVSRSKKPLLPGTGLGLLGGEVAHSVTALPWNK